MPKPPKAQSCFGAVKNAFANAHAAPRLEKEMRDVECPFKVGDHVTSTHRRGGLVTRIDKHANAGLGVIEVTFPDGAVIGRMFPDGGFERDEQRGNRQGRPVMLRLTKNSIGSSADAFSMPIEGPPDRPRRCRTPVGLRGRRDRVRP